MAKPKSAPGNLDTFGVERFLEPSSALPVRLKGDFARERVPGVETGKFRKNSHGGFSACVDRGDVPLSTSAEAR
jgi:hypothetical protein